MEKQPGPGLVRGLSAPAARALQNAGIKTLHQLAGYREAEMLQLHGVGKTSIPKMRAGLESKNLSFKS